MNSFNRVLSMVCLGSKFAHVFAQTPVIPLKQAGQWSEQQHRSIRFTENKGQIKQRDGQTAPYVAYMFESGNARIYLLRNGGMAFQFNRIHFPDGYNAFMLNKTSSRDAAQMEALHKDIRKESYRMDMELVGANPKARIIAEGKSNDYTHYYTHDALFVHHYQRIIYKDVYPGIDWVIYTTPEGGMKYDFQLQPHANPSLIKLKFAHQEELFLDETGNLIHGNRMGRFTEKAPVSYQGDMRIGTRFVLRGGILSFDLNSYDPTRPLTIDPDRIWATYYGGTETEEGRSCATDSEGNVYLAGITTSASDIASGGHQNQIGMFSSDAYLVKFNSKGIRQWATYYGGTGNEWGKSCAVDSEGNVYLAGSTNSTNSIASNGHQNAFGGMTDVFLVKFNALGVRVWATYYGGSEYDADQGPACATDINGNVYLAGSTASPNSIASGGHRDSLLGNDAFLVKFNKNGVRQWATYYGGERGDYGTGCCTDVSGNVYLCGFTESTRFVASGGHQDTLFRNDDAFLVKFSSNGQRIWATYYGGSNSDYAYSCATGAGGYVYLSGGSISEDNIASKGFQNKHAGSGDAFLVKFNSSGIRQWATYYGGAETEFGMSCASDARSNVYLAGFTSSSAAIASGGHQANYGGGTRDAFLVKFNSDGQRLWGTYLGGKDDDLGFSCATDTAGDVYLAGITYSSDSIQYYGLQVNLRGITDGYLAKFSGISCSVDGPKALTTCINTSLNPAITHIGKNTTGIGTPVNLPPGLSANFVSNVVVISGVPSRKGVYDYRIKMLGKGCSDIEATGEITVSENDLSLSSAAGTDSQRVAVNTAISTILYATTGATGIGTPVNLPPGVSASFVSGVIILTGTPTASGTYKYLIPLIGGCGNKVARGHIEVYATSGTERTMAHQAWALYPNPNSGSFVVRNPGRGEFDVQDLTGKTLYSCRSVNEQELSVQVELPAGVYFIRERSSKVVQKLLLQ